MQRLLQRSCKTWSLCMRSGLARFAYQRKTKMRIHRSVRVPSTSHGREVSVSERTSAHGHTVSHSSSANSRRMQVGPRVGGELRQSGATHRQSAQAGGTKRSPQSAHEWVQSHPRQVLQHKGKWLAVSKDGIAATSSKGMDDVFKRARAKGVRSPRVFKVPRDTDRKRVVSVRK